MGKLTAVFVTQTRTPGLYGDGHGLYLNITSGGSRSWIYRYMIRGKRREMGLGSVLLDARERVPNDRRLTLREARDEAARNKQLVRAGIDPIEERDRKERERRETEERERIESEALRAATFEWCSREYIRTHSAAWTNSKHIAQWESTLRAYAFPAIGGLPVSEIRQHHIVRILNPLWRTHTETASRLRGRIERVLSWAAIMGYRDHDNPAQWRGRLAELFPARQKTKPTRHLAALPYSRVPEFMTRLRDVSSIAARALEFCILTATRSTDLHPRRNVGGFNCWNR